MCGAKVVRFAGLSCKITLHPGGANGVASKLNVPLGSEYADYLAFLLGDLSKLRAITDYVMSLSHKFKGKVGCTVHNQAIT